MKNGQFEVGDRVRCEVRLGNNLPMRFNGYIQAITPDGRGTTWYDVKTFGGDEWPCRSEEMTLMSM